MKSGGGKQKGSAFERDICKKLSLWVSDRKQDDLFWRSAMSGGRATVRAKKGHKTDSGHGDITAVVPAGNKLTDRFVIECKHYKSLGLDQHVYGQGPLAGIWDKLIGECVYGKNSKKPMLIFKENRRPVLMGLDFHCIAVNPLCEYRDDLFIYNMVDITAMPFESFLITSGD